MTISQMWNQQWGTPARCADFDSFHFETYRVLLVPRTMWTASLDAQLALAQELSGDVELAVAILLDVGAVLHCIALWFCCSAANPNESYVFLLDWSESMTSTIFTELNQTHRKTGIKWLNWFPGRAGTRILSGRTYRQVVWSRVPRMNWQIWRKGSALEGFRALHETLQ